MRLGASKNGGNKIEKEELGVLGFYRGREEDGEQLGANTAGW